MSEEAVRHWPDVFNVKILSPVAILRLRAKELSAMTHGLLEGEVVSAVTPKRVAHELQLVAPALNGERRTILTVTHATNELYPATVDATVFEPAEEVPDEDWRPVAWTMQEFEVLVQRVIESKPVLATAQSLVARSQEVSSVG
ncbi:MAG: hypothetical protein J0I06_07990 [Planctomycetes bacterium]|nr:hypothetical protein [Planctomycetota bacterium]